MWQLALDGRVSNLIEIYAKKYYDYRHTEVNIDYPEYEDAIEMSNQVLNY